MKLAQPLLPTLVATMLFASPSFVEAKDFTTKGSATLVSQYVFRGADASQEDPAIQGDVIVSHDSGFWFGAWASTYDFGGGEDGVEIDLIAGYSYEVDDSVSINFGLTEYTYTGDADSSTEYSIGVSVDQFSFTYYDDVDLDTNYFSLDAEFKLASEFSLGLHAGRNDPDAGDANNDFSVGLNYAATDSLTVFTSFTSNDADGADEYFVVGATYGF